MSNFATPQKQRSLNLRPQTELVRTGLIFPCSDADWFVFVHKCVALGIHILQQHTVQQIYFTLAPSATARFSPSTCPPTRTGRSGRLWYVRVVSSEELPNLASSLHRHSSDLARIGLHISRNCSLQCCRFSWSE